MADLFTPADHEQMRALGIAPEEAARQVELLRHPPPPTRVVRPCRLGDGIRVLPPEEHPALVAGADRAAAAGRVGRLVPASGAASRMFKTLLSFLAGDDDPRGLAGRAAAGDRGAGEVLRFFAALDRFPFFPDLEAAARTRGRELQLPVPPADYRPLLALLLGDDGLGCAELPKGLIPFHRTPEGARTAVEEHLVEAALAAPAADGACRVELTVAPAHEERFRAVVERARQILEPRLGVRFAVSYSHQSHATDALGVDLQDRPFRLDDGALLFRPAGHGALLRNLQALARSWGDLVQVKNVDNVVPDRGKALVVHWKKLLTGLLATLEERAFALLAALEEPGDGGEETLAAAARFLAGELSRPLPAGFAALPAPARRQRLRDLLDRPLRICGVVRNQGEPGGGPFWVEAPDGEVSAQIVETSQVDLADPGQKAAHAASTHFNPVDLHCALRDRHGRPRDLEPWVDPATVFISRKSHEGRPLKALERPGLWNGAMAGWNTVFVEVPVETFAPVKTVLDLLRPEHQR